MIETEQIVAIDAGIGHVWEFASDIRRWAALMPGLRNCDIIDANQSRWTLKVGAGGLIRTVTVNVRVSEWAGPEKVVFQYELEGDPVQGGGTYVARPLGPDQTEMRLRIDVVGSGQMAKMWEAMGKPLLPQFANAFAQQLKAEIENAAGSDNVLPAAAEDARPLSWAAQLVRFFRTLLGSAGKG